MTIRIFGESHAPEIGVEMDGVPAGTRIDLDELQAFLDRRAPGNGQGGLSTPRREPDRPEFTAGLADGVADGDIEYGDLTTYAALDAVDWYIEDLHFSDLMEIFLRCMKAAKKSGGLYCDGVVSGVDCRAEGEKT